MGKLKSCGVIFLLLYMANACVKPYEPEVITGATAFLVVDGIINCAPDGETRILLTRTRKLSDTVTTIPEMGAVVTIEGENGSRYGLRHDSNGLYRSAPLNLNAGSRYRLLIATADASSYASDFVPVTITPPIDSVNFKQEGNDVTIYANTHDPQNKTRFYRWEYDETWEYRTPYEATLSLKDGRIVYRTDDELTQRCWKSAVATDVVQQSTIKLSEDIVQMAPIVVLSSQSPRFEAKYSINVKQFALTREAYEYWQIIKRNTQQLGSIFDAQPSQLVGNLHNLTKEDEPVIGYITAATIQEKRLFITKAEITNAYSPKSACKTLVIPTETVAAYVAGNPVYAPAYYVGLGGFSVAITTHDCIDCRLAGGTITKPPFWP